MKVVDRNLDSGAPVESGHTHEAQRTGPTTGGATTARPGGGDRVELSSTLGSLARAMSTLSANHAGKVQALSAQYRSGAYRTDSLATSQKMVAHALAVKDE